MEDGEDGEDGKETRRIASAVIRTDKISAPSMSVE